jgi:TetR/AcrR family transcriptional regulator, transcriptional repressor for nem operon
MARPRNFDEVEVVATAATIFARLGFNATSIDDLLQATALQRGSLYKAFGSKRNLFEKTLISALSPGWMHRTESLDLLIVALKELAPQDRPIAALCRSALADSPQEYAYILGNRLLEHLNS